MHPGSDALTTLRQEYNSGLIPNSLDNARMLHQRATQLQLLVDHFRNQLTGDQISGAQNVNCAVTSPGPLVPVFPMDGDNRHRVRSKLTGMTADKGPEEDVRHSPQTNGHSSPVAASLTEALLNQCGLELSWVKLSHIRERPGSQFVWLLFNVSSKRHRLPVGTTERIQGRHSSRMLWPQFSGKSFKMHKKLSFDARKDQPFFVHSLGWSSIDPCAAWKIWGLACRQLTVDDICLVLIRQTGNVRKPRSQVACSTENNPRHVTDHCTPPSICKKQIRQNARETTERGYCLSNTLSLPDVESRTIKYDQETAPVKNSVAHGSFPRNFVPLKRPSSMEEGYSSLMDHEATNEIYNAGNGGLSKRPKTDEPQQQSENRSEKSIFFSATSLAQSHDMHS